METLLDRLRKNNPGDNARKNRHAVAILAHRDEIVAALEDGWSARKIWQQMTNDKTISMCYVSFCRHMKKIIFPSMGGESQPIGPSPAISKPQKKPAKKQTTPESKQTPKPAASLFEQERLDQLREKAFASVRSKKPTGSLIVKPKSREEENRELFGS
jgi:hypothetical protein